VDWFIRVVKRGYGDMLSFWYESVHERLSMYKSLLRSCIGIYCVYTLTSLVMMDVFG